MNSYSIYIFLARKCFLLIIFILVHCNVSKSQEQEFQNITVETEIKHLTSIWDSWNSSVNSLEIKGFRFVGAFKKAGIVFTQGEFEELVQNRLIPFIDKEQINLENLQSKMSISESTIGSWRPFSLAISGDNILVKDTIQGRVNTIVRKSGEEQSYFEGQPQATISRTHTNYRAVTIPHFIYGPSFKLQKGKWTYTKRNGSSELELDGFLSFNYDRETGFLKRYIEKFRGNYIRERFQANAITTPQGIPVARLNAYAKYDTSLPQTIKYVDIFVLKDISVNPVIDESRFRIAVPEGTVVAKIKNPEKIALNSEEREIPLRSTTTEAISDIKKFSETPEFGKSKRPEQITHPLISESDYFPKAATLIVANIVLLLIIFGIVYLKKIKN